MRRRELRTIALLAGLLAGSVWPAIAAPTLAVRVLDPKRVVVRGAGFPDEKLLVSADMDVPHASVACYTDFTRVALVRGAAFEVTLNPSHCDFRCSRDRA